MKHPSWTFWSAKRLLYDHTQFAPYWETNGWIYFNAKHSRSIKADPPNAREKCEPFARDYETMKNEARAYIKKYR